MSRRKRKLTWAAGVIVIVGFLAFVLGGFFGVPWATKSYILPGISSYLNGEIRAGEVHCNPFRLKVTLDDIEIVGDDGKPIVQVDQFVANAGIASVWRLELYLQELDLNQPNVNIDIEPSGESNVADLVEPSLDLWAKILRSPRITVDLAKVRDASATYVDRSLEEPFEHTVSDLDFELTDFSTRPDQQNPYSFVAMTDADEKITWQGYLAFNPLTTSGDFTITGVDLARYFPYAKPYLNSRLTSGKFSVEGNYNFSPVSEPQAVEVTLKSIDVTDVALTPMEGGDPFVKLAKLEIKDALADVLDNKISVASINLQDANANANRLATGKIDLVDWLMPNFSPPGSTTTSGTPASVEQTAATPATTTDVLPPHLQEAQQRLRVALEAMIEAAKSKWDIDVGPITWTSLDAVAIDQSLDQPVRFTLGQFKLTTEPTGSEENFVTPFKAEMVVNENTPIKLDGRITPFEERMEINVLVDRLGISPAGAYLQPLIDGVVDGNLSLQGDAVMALLNGSELQLKYDGSVGVDNLLVQKTGEPEPRLAVNAIDIDNVKLDFADRKVTVNELKIQSPSVAAGLDAQGRPDVFELLRDQDMAAAMAEGATSNANAQPNAPITLPLALSVKQIQLDDGKLVLTDRTVQPAMQLNVTDVVATIANVQSPSETTGMTADAVPDTAIELAMKLDETGNLQVEGNAKPFHQQANLNIKLEQFNIDAANAYLQDKLNAKVAGLLGVTGRATLSPLPDGGYQVTFNQGQIALDQVTASVPDESQPRVKIRQIDLSDVDFQLSPMTAKVATVTVNQPDITAGINADGKLDVLDFLKSSETQDTSDSAKTTGDGDDLDLPLDATIDQVVVRQGILNVSDQRFKPAFKTNVSELNATAKNISTDADNVSTFTADGKIAGSAPFDVSGSVVPLKPEHDTQVAVTLKNFPADVVNTYLIEYLAHPATSGLIDLDVNTTVKQSKLDGELTLLLDNFFLGQKVAKPSENAINVPVKMGMGLLRDRNKMIALESIPISGDLSKPGVDVTELIGKAIGNVITGVITAPFDLLANAAGAVGGKKVGNLAYAEFAPGIHELSPAESAKLDVLANAVEDRPALNLAVIGRTVDADLPVLRKQEAIKQLQKELGQQQGGANAMSPELVEVSDAAYRQWIEQRFNAMFPTALQDGQRTQADTTISFAEKEKTVLAEVDVSEELKQVLAGRRARTVQMILIDDKNMKPDRITVVPQNQADTQAAGDEQPDYADKPRVDFKLR